MAESIYKLFDYESPAALRSNYLKGITSPTSGGDLYSQLAQAGTNTGAILGYGLGRMFGYDAPGVNKAQAIDQIMSEASKGENPLAQAKMAYDLFSAQGMGREAQIAMERLTELQKEAEAKAREAAKLKARETLATSLSTLDPSKPEDQLKLATLAAQAGEGSMAGTAFTAAGTLKKTKADTDAALVAAANRVKAVQNIEKDISEDVAKTIGADKDTYQKFLDATLFAKKQDNTTSTEVINDKLVLLTFNPQNGKIIKRQELGRAQSKQTKVAISLDQKQQGAFLEERGKDQANWLSEALKERSKAQTAIRTLQGMATVNTTDLYSGPQAQIVAGANNFLESLGLLSKAQTRKLTNSVTYDKLAKDLVMQDLDGKLGAQVSDADRKYVEARIPQLTNNPQARTELIQKLIEINERKISYADQMNQHANDNKNLNNFEFKDVYSPRPPAPATPTGASVSNWESK
jgi:hypothetical protein